MNNKTVVAFGELMLRLTASDSILNSNSFSASYGGSESNVLVALSCMGNATRYLTKLPDNDLGRGAIMHLKKYGVDCSNIISDGNNMGIYFYEPGFDSKPAKVIYARKHAEITTLDESAFDYEKIFNGCAIFHISGISFALSSSVETLCFRLIKEAKKRNIPISFDFNYRAKLWSVDEACKVFRRIIPYVDIIFCSNRDLETFLDLTKCNFFNTYANANYLVVREREIISHDKNATKTAVYTKDGCIATSKRCFSVLERIGGGDAFAAGFLHGWLNFGNNIAATLDFATVCFALKHSITGDVLYMSPSDINSYKTASSKDVIR